MDSAKERDMILGTRRDLLGDPLSVEVFSWLRPIYLRPKATSAEAFSKKMGELVTLLEPAVKQNERVRSVVHSLSKIVSTPMAPQYVKGFESVKRLKATPFSTFVSLVYARALLLLAVTADEATRVIPCFKGIVANPEKFENGLAPRKHLGEHFVAHLITLAEIEAQLDPYFQKALKLSTQAFVATHRPNGEVANPLNDGTVGLELLGEKHQSSWWWLPTGVAFALTIWDQKVV
jgi:hypothetical protein